MSGKRVILNRIRKKGGNSVLQLKCEWFNDELSILIIDGRTAWKGKFSTEEIAGFHEALGIARDAYITECQQALSGKDTAEKFSFSIEDNSFVWRKKLEGDITVKFGSIRLSSVALVETLQTFLDFAFDTIRQCQNDVIDTKNKITILDTERTGLISKLEEKTQEKEKMENLLYNKFLSILNAKKERIAFLEQEISDLSLKLQHSTTETENKEYDITDVTEQRLKAEPISKGSKQTRRTSKKPNQCKVGYSVSSDAATTGIQGSSATEVDISGSETKQPGAIKPLRERKNVRTKQQQKAKTTNMAWKKEEIDPSTEKLFLHADSESGDSAPIQLHIDCENIGPAQENLETSCTSSVVPTTMAVSLENHSSIKNDTASQSVSGESNKSTAFQKLSGARTSAMKNGAKDAFASKLVTDFAGPVAGSRAATKAVTKSAEVICPIDLVSGKVDTQSDFRQNDMNKTLEVKNVLSSPTKQRKDFETISPLDMLLPPVESQQHKPTEITKDSLCVRKKDHHENTVRSENRQHSSNLASISEDINFGSDTVVRRGYQSITADISNSERRNPTDVIVMTTSATTSTQHHMGAENNHYDSETDVDEQEEPCKLSDKFKSVNCFLEKVQHDDSCCTIRDSHPGEVHDTHQQKKRSSPEKLLNNSLDTDSSSEEASLADLPKRIRRSERINKCLPVNNKSINHFTQLGHLQRKKETVSHEVNTILYEQETQLVDTQKLLDEL